MARWSGIRLAGRRVVLEPLTAGREDGLWEASARSCDVALSVPQRNAVPVPTSTRRWPRPSRGLGSVRDPRRRPRRRLDPVPGARAGHRRLRDRLDVAPSVGVAERRQRRGEAAPTGGRVRPPRLPARGAEDGRAERALAGSDGHSGRIRGRLPQAHAGQGEPENRDSAWYAIVDDDWPSVRENLERRLAGPHKSGPAPIGRAGSERAPRPGHSASTPSRHVSFPESRCLAGAPRPQGARAGHRTKPRPTVGTGSQGRRAVHPPGRPRSEPESPLRPKEGAWGNHGFPRSVLGSARIEAVAQAVAEQVEGERRPAAPRVRARPSATAARCRSSAPGRACSPARHRLVDADAEEQARLGEHVLRDDQRR